MWACLVAQLDDEAVVLANLRLTDEKKDHEADLVVLIPGAGVVVVEVKGGSVGVDEATGVWRQRRLGKEVKIDPVGQARNTKYALRDFVEQDPRWKGSSRTRVRWAHSVVAPYAVFDPGFATPECPRWAIHDRGDLAHLAGRLRDVGTRQESGRRVLAPDDVDLIVAILRGRMLPHFDVTTEADDREAAADRLSVEQAQLLRVTRLLNRVEVRGGAGSGKTVLAVTQAKELTRGREGTPPQRVALLCYSLGLAGYLKRTMAAAPRRHRPAFVGSFEELGRRWGIDVRLDRSDSDFWERRLPLTMSEAARRLPEKERFDAVIVDEAQDFADDWWQPLMLALRDDETGGLFVYSDDNQRVFHRTGRPPVPLVPLVLDHNLRNTRQIAESFASLAPTRMHAEGGDGVDVTFVPTSTDQALEAADEQVDLLLASGWSPQHVALLTTGSRHPEQTERQQTLGQAGYWASFWEGDDVFYGHVLGCKSLERRAVVLCVNSGADVDRAREKLYVGMSRATDQLVVVGDPQVLAASVATTSRDTSVSPDSEKGDRGRRPGAPSRHPRPPGARRRRVRHGLPVRMPCHPMLAPPGLSRKDGPSHPRYQERTLIFITAKFLVKPEHADAWPEISQEFTEACNAEEGCLWFDWSRSLADPNEYVLVEAFRDGPAGAAHVQSDHFKKATARLPGYLQATPKILNTTIAGTEWSELGEMAVGRG